MPWPLNDDLSAELTGRSGTDIVSTDAVHLYWLLYSASLNSLQTSACSIAQHAGAHDDDDPSRRGLVSAHRSHRLLVVRCAAQQVWVNRRQRQRAVSQRLAQYTFRGHDHEEHLNWAGYLLHSSQNVLDRIVADIRV